MHVPKDLPQHRDTSDSMTYWLETVTAVGVRLEADDTLTVVAPLGTDDLLGLRCRPTAFGRTRRDEYEARVASQALARAVAEGEVPGLGCGLTRNRSSLACGWTDEIGALNAQTARPLQ